MSAFPNRADVRPPTGTVTFAFTDIEGSTQRWDRYGEAMQDAVRRHDALMRAAIVAHGGHVFKTIGDAFCAAFARPEDAVAAMLAAQRTLAVEDFSAIDGLRVRAAIHTGTTDERDGDYFGSVVNRVARLLGIAYGGQILVSGVASDLVQGCLPPQASLRDLGEHRLKDLSRPEYVYQLVAPELRANFPPLRSLDALPNNLPLQLTSFVGRAAEIAKITTLLGTNRLVTLVGSGGIGKTRTSLQVAANLLDGSGDGVWFVELAPLASGTYIVPAIAQLLGLALPASGEALAHLVHAMKAKRALLVFDNCEHLVDAAARTIAALVRGCPHVSVLASSRQGLGVAGEVLFRLPSLDVPKAEGGALLSASDAKQSAAIALFVDRAIAANNLFELTDDTAPIVADICRRLDGIALAIELAASRVKMLSPKQLRERLNERFRILTGGSRDLLPRQQTLRALIDWSHDLLDEPERTLFRRLGIFVNGFTLEAASAVTSDETLDEFGIFDVLASLVEKSLVLAEPHGDSLRYRLLESTHAYASEKLADAGERDALAARLMHYLRDRFAELRRQLLRTARTGEITTYFETELEDIRALLDVDVDRAASRDFVALGELLAEIGAAWGRVGLMHEGVNRVASVLASIECGDARLMARLSTLLADFQGDVGERALALESAREAVEFARASGDAPTLASALGEYAESLMSARRLDEAALALDESEAIPNPPLFRRLQLLDHRALLSLLQGDLDAAARGFEQIRNEHRAMGDVRGAHTGTLNLAEVEHARGRTPRALELLAGVLPALRCGSDTNVFAQALVNSTGYLLAMDDRVAARHAGCEAIRTLLPRAPEHLCLTMAAEHLALADALDGNLERAARLEGHAGAHFRRLGYQRDTAERITYDRLLALLRARFSQDDLTRLTADGEALTREAALALALEGAPS